MLGAMYYWHLYREAHALPRYKFWLFFYWNKMTSQRANHRYHHPLLNSVKRAWLHSVQKSSRYNQYPLSSWPGSSDSYRLVFWARFSWQGLVSVKNLTKQVASRILSTSEILFTILSSQQWAPTMKNIIHDPSESKNGVSMTREKQVNFLFLVFSSTWKKS